MRWSPQIRRLDWLTARPIAHRGLHDCGRGVIENTASAFAGAIAGGYAIECDVQLTADGGAVVFHDHHLERLTCSRGWLKQQTVPELKKVELRQTTDRIQTLAELLEQVGGRVPLIIEIKSHWDGDCTLAEQVLKTTEKYPGPYAIMSFDPDVLGCVEERSPDTVRGIVADRAKGYSHISFARRLEMRRFSHCLWTRPHFISFQWQAMPFAPVNRFRAAGWPVISWTIRSAEEASVARRYSDQITFEGFIP
jgi:glycerophosphoryl diester phosphodiesterase